MFNIMYKKDIQYKHPVKLTWSTFLRAYLCRTRRNIDPMDYHKYYRIWW